MNDPYTRLNELPHKAAELTTHNTNALSPVPDWIYIGVDGDVKCRPIGSDTDVTFKNVRAGLLLYVKVTHIRTTGTTAGGLVGLYL